MAKVAETVTRARVKEYPLGNDDVAILFGPVNALTCNFPILDLFA